MLSLTSSSRDFAEPCRLTDTEHVLICAMSLAQKNEYATDALILHLIRMHIKAQEHHDQLANPEALESVEFEQFGAYLTNVEESMLEIKKSLPLVLQNSSKTCGLQCKVIGDFADNLCCSFG
jgi:hypothetical protein